MPLFTDSQKNANITDVLTSDQPLVLVGPIRNYAFRPIRGILSRPNVEVLDFAQLRDPLDTIVSQYFSHGWIHVDRNFDDHTKSLRLDIQSGKLDVFTYAKMEIEGNAGFGGGSIAMKFQSLGEEIEGVHRKRVHYEDLVLNYDKWAADVGSLVSPWINIINELEEVRPRYEQTNTGDKSFYDTALEYAVEIGLDKSKGTHIRNAFPGDHKRFLKATQIAELRSLFKVASLSV